MNRSDIRLLVVDDHRMVASALAHALTQTARISISDVVESVEELRRHCARLGSSDHPDVAVIDYSLPDGTGTDAAGVLKEYCPLTRCVLVSASSSPACLREALRAGCVAYVSKSSALADLVRAVDAASRGEATFDAEALRGALSDQTPLDTQPSYGLSRRETEILSMLAAGATTEVMATQLDLSLHTVRNHVRNLTAKLGAHSRLEAVSIAARAGLVTLITASGT